LRIRFARGFWTSQFGIALLSSVLLLFVAGTAVFVYHYIQYSQMIEARLSGEVFANTSRVFAAPRRLYTGEPLSLAELTAALQRAGYQQGESAEAPGRYSVTGSTVFIRPGKSSYFSGVNALRVDFGGREITHLETLADHAALTSAEIEPEPLTNLFDSSREKRRIVKMDDLPKVLVDAVLSAEDKRFFEHSGLDPIRVLGAAWADLRHRSVGQGASTLTMQVARSFFFTTERTWRRKLAETMVAFQLEKRFSKQQIFELYANEIYLGNRGSFAIRGFGEGAQAYFGKDVHDLTLPEAAFLAGIIRAPNRYAVAEHKPERIAEARDRVLTQMLENKQITQEKFEAAKRVPLRLARGGGDTGSAPYFVDMVKDHLLDHLSEADLSSQSYRIYTTIDPNLQRAAVEAVEAGMKEVDAQLAKRYARWKKENQRAGKSESGPLAQVAMVVLDPRTGEIRALVGGRDYGSSQLNRALSRRQPGSAFKPFVYAAAFDNAVEGLTPVFTPLTTVVDEPTTFLFDGKEYTPNNYGEKFYGTVTLREAMIRSLNVATVRVAEMVGYQHVVDIARQAGLDPRIQATPAVALGAYDMSPLEVAAGYTVFPSNGIRAEPLYVRGVRDVSGEWIERTQPRTRPGLDPRVAYMVTNIMEDVINRGTAATVRARGFTAPAAGKTGTSHDGWFAGFTSNLICVVWVGFDDNRELNLAGGASAAPVWTEFMKRAVALPEYANVQPFSPPDGLSVVTVDPETLQRATPLCPVSRPEVFLLGTEPAEYCERHGGARAAEMLAQSTLPSGQQPLQGVGGNSPNGVPSSKSTATGKLPTQEAKNTPPQNAPAPEAPKKKGFWARVFGIFGPGKKP
jgi:penicillin-binding protein 1B